MKSDQETRARLLSVGARLFGARGFKKVTVREICREAKANVAAVNYHFGDKLGLYREVLQSAIEGMRSTTDDARKQGRGRPAEEELRLYLSIFLKRVLSPESESIHRLLAREMSDPTPALDDIIEQGVRPRIAYLSDLVSRILKCPTDDPRVLRCVGSIQAQATTYFKNPIAARLGFTFGPTPANIAAVADHVATFSIAGIRAVARERRPAGSRPRDGRDQGRVGPGGQANMIGGRTWKIG